MIFSVLMMLSLAGADGFGYFDPESMDDCSSYHDWQSCVTRGGTYDIGDDPSLKIARIAGVHKFGTSYYLGVGFNHEMREYADSPGCEPSSRPPRALD